MLSIWDPSFMIPTNQVFHDRHMFYYTDGDIENNYLLSLHWLNPSDSLLLVTAHRMKVVIWSKHSQMRVSWISQKPTNRLLINLYTHMDYGDKPDPFFLLEIWAEVSDQVHQLIGAPKGRATGRSSEQVCGPWVGGGRAEMSAQSPETGSSECLLQRRAIKKWTFPKGGQEFASIPCKVVSKPWDAWLPKSESVYLEALDHHPASSNTIDSADLPVSEGIHWTLRAGGGWDEPGAQSDLSPRWDPTRTQCSGFRWAPSVESIHTSPPCISSHFASERINTVYDFKRQELWKGHVWNVPSPRPSWHTCQATWTKSTSRRCWCLWI